MKKACIMFLLIAMIGMLVSCASTANLHIPPVQLAQSGGGECENLEFSSEIELASVDEMPVFAMKIADKNTQIEEIKLLLGIDVNESKLIDENEMHSLYEVKNGTVMLDSELGFWVYSTPIGVEPSNNLLTDKETLEIADKYVQDSGLYDGKLGNGIISYVTTGDGSITDSNAIVQKHVYYYPQIDGHNVYGVFRLVVGIGSGGEINYVSKQLHNIEKVSSVKLKDLSEIKSEVEMGKYVLGTDAPILNAEITSCNLVYYSDIVPSEGNLFLQPTYVLNAVGTHEDKGVEKFDVLIDAVKR